MTNPVPALRRIAFIEGVSFLVLLGIAMPLRHFAGLPRAVTVFGWLHGILFIWLCLALLRTRSVGWSVLRMAAVFVAALVPFGTFLIDPRMRAWQAEADRDPVARDA